MKPQGKSRETVKKDIERPAARENSSKRKAKEDKGR
jgi:hypothetical protein